MTSVPALAFRLGLLPLGLLLALPVLAVLGAWGGLDAAGWRDLVHEWQTVLPRDAAVSLTLAVAVALGVALVGTATAAAVSLFDFPGRRVFEWALLLPLAMPAYVLAYATTDALQYSGPLQSAWRAWSGREAPLWPDVRSLGGAVPLFVLCLYPYVYLLVRAALVERGPALLEAARLLGAPLGRRLREVALPLARPAIAAGTALAVMETLADFGVGAYFGLTTFTTGIYKAWLVLDDREGAARLASVLLLVVALVVGLERRARRQLRYAVAKPGNARSGEARPIRLHGLAAALAFAGCAVPVLLGFVLPVGWLLVLAAPEGRDVLDGPGLRFLDWAGSSLKLALLAALLAGLLALGLGYAERRPQPGMADAALRGTSRLVALGYAVPGVVIAIGILVIAGALQRTWPRVDTAAWFTGSIAGVIYAYLVRFTAVAQQSVQAGYSRIPRQIDESARMLGAAGSRMFWQLHLPLLRRSVSAAALLVFVDVMKELPATLVLRPFDSDTLAVVAYQFARDERLAEAALPSLAIVVAGLLPVMLLSRALRRESGG